MALALVLTLALGVAEAPPPPLTVMVFVPLCNGAQLACGPGALGDPTSLEGNLYWGARYGAERFLRGQPEYRFDTPAPAEGPSGRALLRTLKATRTPRAGEHELKVTLLAWDGRFMDRALMEFLAAVQLHRADLVVWAGHDALMDMPQPILDRGFGPPAAAAVLACESERYFGPVLEEMGAHSVALTRTFMAPEGYLVDALLDSVAANGVAHRRALRDALTEAYARYQRISLRAAASVFSKLE